MAEELTRQRLEEWASAIRAKDLQAVLSFYAPEILSFDLDPPLRYTGIENKRRAWQAFFDAHAVVTAYELHELDVTSRGDLAFVHSLNHVTGTLAGGKVSDLWVRWTACFRQSDGLWRIVHDHVSVPADLTHGRAALDLHP
jgi:ketosteroid isomerase-like protein